MPVYPQLCHCGGRPGEPSPFACDCHCHPQPTPLDGAVPVRRLEEITQRILPNPGAKCSICGHEAHDGLLCVRSVQDPHTDEMRICACTGG